MSKQSTFLGPDFSYEGNHKGVIAGIDEAGRGPLAGPVIAAAVILDQDNIPPGLNDSKMLKPGDRDRLYEQLQSCATIGVGIAEVDEIERLNILGATMAAMRRAATDLPLAIDVALVDGNRDPQLGILTQTIIKGDSKSLSIAAASIIAKVTRDRIMARAGDRFTGYGFAGHKGYPTPAHRSLLGDRGPCPVHRRTFAPVTAALTRMNKTLKN